MRVVGNRAVKVAAVLSIESSVVVFLGCLGSFLPRGMFGRERCAGASEEHDGDYHSQNMLCSVPDHRLPIISTQILSNQIVGAILV